MSRFETECLQPEPSLLTSISGEKIKTKEQWEQFRREECMELLATYVYGRQPVGKPEDLTFTTKVKNDDLDGLVFKEVTVCFKEFAFTVKVYHKKDAKSLPVFLYFMHMKEQNTLFNENEAETVNAPIKDICHRGYAFIVMQYTSIYHDDFTCADYEASLFKPFSPPRAERADTDWGAIALWAWAASRVMDYIESEDTYDSSNVAVVGHSRGGKTALWTGATDPRFSFVVSNSSGCMGAAMLRGKKGEHLDYITQHTDWFCKNLDHYIENEQMLPVDQHLLLACIAPRPLYVASNSLDEWADPAAERRGARLAGEAYALYGLKGAVLPEDDRIECGKAYHEGQIGYHMSEGAHKIRAHDWEKFMAFWEKTREER